MVRRVIGLILLMLMFTLAPTTGKLNDENDSYKLGLVKINYNFKYMTTGFFIDNDGLIMTVAHALPGGAYDAFITEYQIYVETMDTSTIYKAQIVAVSRKSDILLLKIDGYDVKVFFDKFDQPIENEDVTMVGFPTMEWYSQKDGNIVINDVRNFVGVDEGLAGGSSGSPVFNKDRHIVGMVNRMDTRVEFTMIVSGMALKVFYKAYLEAVDSNY